MGCAGVRATVAAETGESALGVEFLKQNAQGFGKRTEYQA
jgi:hypothetical protein